MIAERPPLQRLADDEPVQIKRPDRTPLGRHLTLGDFRRRDVASEGDDVEGSSRAPSQSA